jgi:hypothetical protein
VPEAVVRRRVVAGLRNFFEVDRTVVDGWHMYDNSTVTGPRLTANGAAGARPPWLTMVDGVAWKNTDDQST